MWHATVSRLDQFREARVACASLTDRLGQATLGTSWGYSYAGGAPSGYARKSELRFRSGSAAAVTGSAAVRPTHALFFFAPLGRVADAATYGGLSGLLNACGYFVEWNNDSVERPSLLPQSASYHFRLMEFVQPSEQMAIYAKTAPAFSLASPGQAGPSAGAWTTDALDASPAAIRPLCRNVIALIVLPSLAPRDDPATSYNDVTALAPGYA